MPAAQLACDRSHKLARKPGKRASPKRSCCDVFSSIATFQQGEGSSGVLPFVEGSSERHLRIIPSGLTFDTRATCSKMSSI